MNNVRTLGVIGQSSKPAERRLPIHPAHFDRIDAELRSRIYLEEGYGHAFGYSDDTLSGLVAGIRTRKEILAETDVVLLPKPLAADLAELRTGQVLWGWPHCVQDTELTQIAIDKKLTLIAFEAMNHWHSDGSFNLHVFHKNNELAGYSSVLHALQLIGSTGDYGRRLTAAVIGFGATARGAVTALKAHGIHEVDVLTQRGVTAVSSPIHSARMVSFDNNNGDVRGSHVMIDNHSVPVPGFLAEHDIVVNCVLQNTDTPLTFLTEEDLVNFQPGSLIVDVSCDEGMGFSWARPTSFAEPTFIVGDNITYYGVDHSPSYLWNSASWEISESLLPYLPAVMAGETAWKADETLERAIEIRDGVIVNPAITRFQHRSPDYPHPILA
ncbi:alanine dehydrogenase [Rhodococcus sp. ACPA4]|uniref:N(5)-(Carboxyethyl)ornithine synthase n=1 Tax=Rhodococcus globerulus TaxID=33008 RepID=A0ABU4C0B9_RHOGO|nr:MULTISPECIES: N(5)-(carboxyethyl)ornithine synthase [Rhodococcus]MDV6269927.1 N(5)-(carboxyethyl)ornithine synthase [Rhodococcus globerulus]MDV8070430.1 N(5)-(carboxyethyl)ornithine synthase [Rhodococcus sp. IEGM 1366]NRI67708.1 alanine dehydrogenase [Rhodococcus sp. MS16]PBC38205.1 alanine dehydrogenase [Rhodococcus sp. ACPA4]QXW01873.1 N(5)-(carboxyethyl)ornithine synthase [Rhodococcus globerulus]